MIVKRIYNRGDEGSHSMRGMDSGSNCTLLNIIVLKPRFLSADHNERRLDYLVS